MTAADVVERGEITTSIRYMGAAARATDHRAVLADILAADDAGRTYDADDHAVLADLAAAGLITVHLGVRNPDRTTVLIARPTTKARHTTRYVTVTLVVPMGDLGPVAADEDDADTELVATAVTDAGFTVLWWGSEAGVTPAALAGGALPDEWTE